MDQIAIGNFIAKKRKEQNLTQEQLAERLGVSNKTISKWETGKCMPDYSIVELLCKELNITLAELMNGEEDEKSIHTYDNEQILTMLKDMKKLKNAKMRLIGFILIVIGIATFVLSQIVGGTDLQDFLSGFMIVVSIFNAISGIFLLGCSIVNNKKN